MEGVEESAEAALAAAPGEEELESAPQGSSSRGGEEEELVEEVAPSKGLPVKKPMSAFLHYCAEQRPAVKVVMPNASAGDITKAISESWRALSDEEKKRFVDMATADKDRYERERGSAPKATPAAAKTIEPHETVIPVGRVKKIAKLDPEMKSVSKEATAVIAKMTELFVSKLATETHVASSGKKIIKASDVAFCIHNRPAFAWLRPDYPLTEYSQNKPPNNGPRPPKKPDNNTTIQQFFQPAKKQAIDPTLPDDAPDDSGPAHQLFASSAPLDQPDEGHRDDDHAINDDDL